jgi:hypothetical protein
MLSSLPLPIKQPLRRIKTWFTALPYHGNARYCPICQKTSARFRPFGDPPRNDAHCPHCFSLERHRVTWLFFERNTDLFDGRPKRMLHVAPEPGVQRRLKHQLGSGYLTADLLDRETMVRMDITNIQYPNASFDIVYCSHVLEHVPDDRTAMRELRRVLKPHGWAVFLVPQHSGPTYEDFGITDPAARRIAFGQDDHVRRYGEDFPDRLIEAGFRVNTFSPSDIASAEEISRMALTAATGDIFYCTHSGRTD